MFWDDGRLIGGEGTKQTSITANNYDYRAYVKLDRAISTGVPGYFTDMNTVGGALLLKTDNDEEYELHLYYANTDGGGTYENAKAMAQQGGILYKDLGIFTSSGYRFADDYPWYSYRTSILSAEFHDTDKMQFTL